jgi:glycosyltransferase involved in cell wall biosynthesis
MRIAIVAPLYESVPPQLYGGTERVVSYLAEELVALGHHVTLFASGDSVTRAELVPVVPRALRLTGCNDPLACHVLMLGKLAMRIRDFDIVHYHIDYVHIPTSRAFDFPRITTMHGRSDLPELRQLFGHFEDEPLVSISNAQRMALPSANWLTTAYHGLPLSLYTPSAASADQYLVFIGRLCREKRVDRAIEIASKANLRLKIAAKIDSADREYFDREVRPLLSQSHVEFIGEVNDAGKAELLRRARALLFPIDWPEPFGLVMIEAMACGTPVIAWPYGSSSEIIRAGENGYLVNSIDDAVSAVHAIEPTMRHRCRCVFQERFSSRQMAKNYVSVFERQLGLRAAAFREGTRLARGILQH